VCVQTVIFDCCNSGSGTRGTAIAPTRISRGITLDDAEPLPATLDEDVWAAVPKDRAIAVAAGFAQAGARSHVLLAACTSTEVAQEENRRGVFTAALLDALRVAGTTKVTYVELLERLPDLPGCVALSSINGGRLLRSRRDAAATGKRHNAKA
jgi:hypothetical protein